MNLFSKLSFVWILLFLGTGTIKIYAHVPVLKLKDAIQIALTHYKTIDAGRNYARAAKSQVEDVQSQYLPDLNIGAQNAYGTINGLNGPNFNLPGISTVSGSVVSPAQNWNAAFGSLYAATINWQFFTFGNHAAYVKAAKEQYQNQLDALGQEEFQLQGNVCGAYLNLLSAQRLLLSMQENLERTTTLRKLIVTRTAYGLNPGVDSAIANAELSKARLSLLDAQQIVESRTSQLTILLGDHRKAENLDTSFIALRPTNIGLEKVTVGLQHPILNFLNSKIDVSELQSEAISTAKWAKFSLFTLYQGKGSGFGSNYGTAGNTAINQSLPAGLDPVRSNYIFGISAVWNLSDVIRMGKRQRTQDYLTVAYRDEFELQKITLQDQLSFADQQIITALKEYNEAPIQLSSANSAYHQKNSLYKNGLATITDVTQALYTINRAQTDADLAYNGLWQALLYKAFTSGDLNLFLSQVN